MEKIIEVPFQSGTLLFEHRDPAGPEAHSGPGEVVTKAQESFEAALRGVNEMGKELAASLADIKFQTAEATFGIKFSGKGKLLIAEASAEASLAIKLVFKGPA